MALNGPDALRSLDEALRDIRREEDEIAKRVSRSADLIAKMREQEGDLLRQLAAVRLDPAIQAELNGRLSQAELKARDMLKQHGEALAETESKLKALDASIAELQAARATLQLDAGKRDAELKAISEKVKPSLLQDSAYAKALADASELSAVADESLRKTRQAEADREQKGRPYRDDPLFMYLWDSGYGTRTYRANNLVVWLDGLVANLVGFAAARPNFVMLNEIPLRLREHAERQRANAGEAGRTVTSLESAAIDNAGGKAAREALENVTARVKEIDQETVATEDQRDQLTRSQRELVQGSDPAFAAATATLAETLGHEDIKTLLADARLTRTGQDDTIVQQIDDARQRAAEETTDTREQKTRLKTLASRRRELEDIQYEFKKQGYDNPRSSFGEDNLVGDMLNEFLRGGLSAASYWEAWRRSQNWVGGPPNDPWNFDERFGSGSARSGGVNWPDNSFAGGVANRTGSGGAWGRTPGFGGGRSPGGGGFSRPRQGSSGTRSGGGFKTGGGF